MSAGYIDAAFAFEIGMTGYSWFPTYKVYEKVNEVRQLVFCHNAKISMFTVKNHKQTRTRMNPKKKDN